MARSHLINTGARASARFNVGEPVDFRPVFGNGKLKRRERRAPFAIYEISSNDEREKELLNETARNFSAAAVEHRSTPFFIPAAQIFGGERRAATSGRRSAPISPFGCAALRLSDVDVRHSTS